MGAIFDVPRMELSGIQVFAPADISMHQDVALLATACTNLQTCFNLYPKPIARTIDLLAHRYATFLCSWDVEI